MEDKPENRRLLLVSRLQKDGCTPSKDLLQPTKIKVLWAVMWYQNEIMGSFWCGNVSSIINNAQYPGSHRITRQFDDVEKAC